MQQAVRTGKVDLRKVDGDVNPADLLTKHSLSRDRLLKLVELFNCKYVGGRAASAPQLRRGASSKTTLADADELNAAADRPSAAAEKEEPQASACERPPMMPHTLYPHDELDKLFPPLEAPDAECLDDSHERAAEAQDAVLQHGLRLANQIQDDMVANGRRRRPSGPARSAAFTALTDRPTDRTVRPSDRPTDRTVRPSVQATTTSTSSPSSTGPDLPMRRADSKSSRIAGGVRKSGVLLASTSTSSPRVARKSLRPVNGRSFGRTFASSSATCSNGLALAQAKLQP